MDLFAQETIGFDPEVEYVNLLGEMRKYQDRNAQKIAKLLKEGKLKEAKRRTIEFNNNTMERMEEQFELGGVDPELHELRTTLELPIPKEV